MTTVTYTHDLDVNSSAVDQAYYNANTKELVVDLHDTLYRYSGVPLDVAVEVTQPGISAGGDWLPRIKRNYGPSQVLGNEWNARFVYEAPASQAAPVVPKGLSVAPTAQVTNTTNVFSLTASAPTLRQHKVSFETPNGVKSHTFRAESVDEAVEQIEALGDMLDVDFVVKEVTVYFE